LAIVVGITYLRDWRHPSQPAATGLDPKDLVGRQFPVSQPWAAYQKTVVLALSVGCKYCSASAPFYQRLTAYAESRQVRVIALLPQSEEESALYLKALKVNIPIVAQVDFQQINVGGTPTLFLVDPKGIVQEAWQGQLQESRERKLFSVL
jgi:hypothetical protein